MSFLSERLRCGYSQAYVAKKLGVTDAAVSMWEKGKTYPRAQLLPRLAMLYQCTVEKLLEHDDPAQE